MNEEFNSELVTGPIASAVAFSSFHCAVMVIYVCT